MIACVIHVKNEEHFLPGFLDHLRDYVDGFYVIDDGSTDGTLEILKKEPKLKKLHCNPPREKVGFDEQRDRQKGYQMAKDDGADWILLGDPDERYELGFLQKLGTLTKEDKDVVYQIYFKECWDRADQYRDDGIWAQKRKGVLFRVPDKIELMQQTYHGIPYPSCLIGKEEKLNYALYHLRMVLPELREARKNLYNTVDPNKECQAIGYDYLTEEKDLHLTKIEHPCRYDYRTLPGTWKTNEFLQERNLYLSLRPSNGHVLMTSLYLCGYTGSEWHILEMAEQFIGHDYEVTIMVGKMAEPMAGKARALGAFVLDAKNDRLARKAYDIFFAQHHTIAEGVVIQNRFICKKCISSHLGTVALESVSSFEEYADLILANSEETKEKLEAGLNQEVRCQVFPNYAGAAFFNAYEKNAIERKIKNIAIISNHIPEELKQMADYALEKGISVKYYGNETGSQRKAVNAALLNEFDVIVSIGRTVQYCLAMGKPVYVYDYFGGPGYLTEENFEIAQKYNFSGRGFECTKPGDRLLQEIIEGYSKQLTYLEKWHIKAKESFDLNKNFSNMLHILSDIPDQDKCMADHMTEREKEHVLSYFENTDFPLYQPILCNFFWKKEQEQAYPIETRRQILVQQGQETQVNLNVGYDIGSLWLQIESPFAIVRIDSMKVDGMEQNEKKAYVTATRSLSEGTMILDVNPSIVWEHLGGCNKEIQISFSCNAATPEQIQKAMEMDVAANQHLQNEVQCLQNSVEQGQRQLQEMRESTSWRITAPLRKLRSIGKGK